MTNRMMFDVQDRSFKGDLIQLKAEKFNFSQELDNEVNINLFLPQLRLPGFEGHRLWPVICSILLFPWPSVSLCLWRAVYCLLPLPLPCLKVTRSRGRGQLIWILEPVTRDKRPNNQTMESVSSIVKRRSTVNNYLHMTWTKIESKFKQKNFNMHLRPRCAVCKISVTDITLYFKLDLSH